MSDTTCKSAATWSHFFHKPRFFCSLIIVLSLLSGCKTEGYIEFSKHPSSLTIDHQDEFIKIENTLSAIQWKTLNTNNGKFIKLYVDKYRSAGKNGTPELFSINKLIKSKTRLALTVNIDSTSVQTSNHHIGKHPLFPVQPNASKPNDDEIIITSIDHAAYASDEWLAPKMIQLEELGKLKGEYTYRLKISPIRYHPASNKIEVVTKFSAKLIPR